MKKFNKSLVIVLIVALLCVFVCGCGNNGGEQQVKAANYTWGSAALGTATYVMIEAMASTANKYVESKNSSVSTSGSAENVQLVDQGEVSFGSGTSDTLWYAYNGMQPYDGKKEFAQVLTYTGWSIPMLVRADSGIEKVEDLVGRTVAIGTSGQAASSMWLAIFDAYGIKDKVNWQYMASADSADAFQAGQIEGVASPMVLGSVLDTSMQQLAQNMEFKPVKVDKTKLDQICANNPGLMEVVTTGATFNVPVEDQYDIGNTGIVICDPNLPEEDVYAIVKALYEHSDDLKKLSSRLNNFAPEYGVEGLISSFPLHPGAEKYFKEVGVIK